MMRFTLKLKHQRSLYAAILPSIFMVIPPWRQRRGLSYAEAT